MKRMGRLLTVLLLSALLSTVAFAAGKKTTTVLFTHDLHSHFLPVPTASGGESGGYARLATLLNRQREKYPDALTLDGGDFSIGSLFQTLYTTQGAELRTMGAMGYDATTVGNHEFDHTSRGFGEMLNAASKAGIADMVLRLRMEQGTLEEGELEEYERQYGPRTSRGPVLVQANYWPASSDPDKPFVMEAFVDYQSLQGCCLIERGGVTYGVFGLMGKDAHDCAPTSGFDLGDPIETARESVDWIRGMGADFIICLSHGGTDPDPEKSEDELLAKAVPGIDLIISGHTHTTLEEPVVVNDTYIVSCGQYGENLGSITLEWDENGKTLKEYELIPVDETVEEDPTIAAMVEEWKTRVSEGYLANYGLTYDQVLTHTDFDLDTPESGVQQGNNLGELVSDAFLWATKHLEADAPDVKTIAVTADGVLRADLPKGELTTSMAFDVLSMGVGADGTSGFPLVAVYLTGKELKAAAEVDASVTPIMPAAQLYMSGMAYSFNTNRMFFNRVMDTWLEKPAFETGLTARELTRLEDEQLYRVVTGMYSAQMLGTVKSKSVGLLSLEPKMADGTPVTDFNACILRDEQGNEIKEWYALAAYLNSFGEDGVPDHYQIPDGRKTVSSSLNPVELLKNPNRITLAVLAIALALVACAVWVTRKVISRRRNKRSGDCR